MRAEHALQRAVNATQLAEWDTIVARAQALLLDGAEGPADLRSFYTQRWTPAAHDRLSRWIRQCSRRARAPRNPSVAAAVR